MFFSLGAEGRPVDVEVIIDGPSPGTDDSFSLARGQTLDRELTAQVGSLQSPYAVKCVNRFDPRNAEELSNITFLVFPPA